MPFPNEETTPPVTKMYFVFILNCFEVCLFFYYFTFLLFLLLSDVFLVLSEFPFSDMRQTVVLIVL